MTFFSSRWRGQVPPKTLIWWDMLIIGTLANVAASMLILGLMASDIAETLIPVLSLSMISYNLFLVLAVYRCRRRSAIDETLALCWFIGALVI